MNFGLGPSDRRAGPGEILKFLPVLTSIENFNMKAMLQPKLTFLTYSTCCYGSIQV
jgi:hypothetical protein